MAGGERARHSHIVALLLGFDHESHLRVRAAVESVVALAEAEELGEAVLAVEVHQAAIVVELCLVWARAHTQGAVRDGGWPGTGDGRGGDCARRGAHCVG